MKPHRFDPLSFTFGLVFAALTVLLAFPHINFDVFGFSWVAAGVLLVVGIAMIATSRSRDRES